MNKVKIEFVKKAQDALVPELTTAGSYALKVLKGEMHRNADNTGLLVYGCGIAVTIPEGYVGVIYPDVSIAGTSIMFAESVKILPAGESLLDIAFKFTSGTALATAYEKDKIYGQLFIVPVVVPEVDVLEYVEQTEPITAAKVQVNTQEI